MKMENLALAREKIVFDVEPVHGLEMPFQNSDRDQLGELGGLVVALLDSVKRGRAGGKVLLVLLVPARSPGIDVPAVVIEARLVCKSLDFGMGLFLQMRKADHYIGHLDAGVVDVILDVDFPSRIAQQANERVAENRVAQMPNVRGLVGIDARVLDQNFARRDIG